jgi:phosphoribosylamine---glycine ligase
MKVLVIGGGGREHALVWKISQSEKVSAIYCIPGNGGISDLADCVDINIADTAALVAFSKREKVGLAVVGPENALAEGVVDAFESENIPIFGPRKEGALIETSKIFAKELMREYAVPTAAFKTFSRYNEAREHLDTLRPPYVIKADGLCAGKGAYVIKEKTEGDAVLKNLMVDLIHGEAGRNVVVEDFLSGYEASYLAFTDGETVLPMPPSQDHKTLLDGDKGANTGGMGAYTPIPFISKKLEDVIDRTVMERTVNALRCRDIIYKGVLYGGLMLTKEEPFVIEFNARFGDPETQPIMFKMETDIVPVLMACANGTLEEVGSISWKEGVSVCVVIAAAGYPEKPEKGRVIHGLGSLADRKDIVVFHAGTKKVGKEYVTAGGRVLGVTALGSTYADAIAKAYDAVNAIEFEGMYYRRDIGRKALQTEKQ